MLRKIKSSLTIRLFMITLLLLAFVCTLTYGFIALFMPLSYSNQISQSLENRTHKLIKDLSNITLDESGSLLTAYIIETNTSVVLLDAKGDVVETPAGPTLYYYEEPDHTTLVTEYPLDNRTPDAYGIDITGESIFTSGFVEDTDSVWNAKDREWIFSGDIINLNFPLRFAQDTEDYRLIISFANFPANQALEALGQIFPWLILLIFSVSTVGALLYSRYVTRPIIKISGISQRMSALEFNWHCDDSRTDEIGVLARSLNQMSEKLSRTLDELHTANAALKTDIERERELEQNRLAFFASVSHELKTPITVIKGQIEGMLGNVGAYRDREKYLNRSLVVARTLEDMVQDILAISRMESSGFTLQTTEVDFTALVQDVVESLGELAEQRGLALNVDIEEGLLVQADKKLLGKVLTNLMSNAAFYSPAGERILIKAYKEEGRNIFRIENTGASIPADALPKVFDAFFRVEKSRNRKTGGTGLGLYFVKMILELHSAKYSMHNTMGGVEFTFALRNNEQHEAQDK